MALGFTFNGWIGIGLASAVLFWMVALPKERRAAVRLAVAQGLSWCRVKLGSWLRPLLRVVALVLGATAVAAFLGLDLPASARWAAVLVGVLALAIHLAPAPAEPH